MFFLRYKLPGVSGKVIAEFKCWPLMFLSKYIQYLLPSNWVPVHFLYVEVEHGSLVCSAIYNAKCPLCSILQLWFSFLVRSYCVHVTLIVYNDLFVLQIALWFFSSEKYVMGLFVCYRRRTTQNSNRRMWKIGRIVSICVMTQYPITKYKWFSIQRHKWFAFVVG